MGRQATGTVDFRGNPPRWWARVTVRDEHGRLHRPWVDLERPDLKDDRPNGPDYQTARRLARKRAKRAAKASYVGRELATGSTLKLADLEDKWFALLDRNPDLAAKTVDRYKTSWRAYILPAFEKLAIKDITPPRVREWIWKRRNETSTSSTLNDCNAFSRFFTDAIRERWIPGPHPFRDDMVKEAKPKQEHPESEDITKWTQDMVERLLAVPEMPDVVFGLFLVDTTSGMRDGEERGLPFKHTKDPRDGKQCINILQQAIDTEEDGLHLGPPKWGSKRMIPQHPQAATWLAWWEAEGWERYVGRKPTAEDFVFPDAEGDMVRPQDSKLVQKWAARAGLPTTFTRADGTTDNVDMQMLRRTFASMLGELEVDGEVLDRLMGHKPKTVRGRHYMAITFERMQRALERLVLVLPDRPGVAAGIVPRIVPDAPAPANDDGAQRLQPTGTTGDSAQRRRVASWRGPRSSKPV